MTSKRAPHSRTRGARHGHCPSRSRRRFPRLIAHWAAHPIDWTRIEPHPALARMGRGALHDAAYCAAASTPRARRGRRAGRLHVHEASRAHGHRGGDVSPAAERSDELRVVAFVAALERRGDGGRPALRRVARARHGPWPVDRAFQAIDACDRRGWLARAVRPRRAVRRPCAPHRRDRTPSRP